MRILTTQIRTAEESHLYSNKQSLGNYGPRGVASISGRECGLFLKTKEVATDIKDSYNQHPNPEGVQYH
jgi:hypothetical protein